MGGGSDGAASGTLGSGGGAGGGDGAGGGVGSAAFVWLDLFGAGAGAGAGAGGAGVGAGAGVGGAPNARPDAKHTASTNDPLPRARMRPRLSRARRACAIARPEALPEAEPKTTI